jgi:hypothetical protein
MISVRLTGKTRARPIQRLLRQPLLVLQVEEHRKGYELDQHGGSWDVDYCEWRDARVEDMEELHRIWTELSVLSALGGRSL